MNREDPATWRSVDESVAVLVDAVNEPGLVQVIVDDGRSTTIEAELGGVTGEATITSSP